MSKYVWHWRPIRIQQKRENTCWHAGLRHSLTASKSGGHNPYMRNRQGLELSLKFVNAWDLRTATPAKGQTGKYKLVANSWRFLPIPFLHVFLSEALPVPKLWVRWGLRMMDQKSHALQFWKQTGDLKNRNMWYETMRHSGGQGPSRRPASPNNSQF